MRRPLAFCCLIFAAAVYIVLLTSPVSCPDYSDYDQKEVTVSGTVKSTERKVSSDGSISLLLTLCDIAGNEDIPETKDLVLVRIPCSSEEEFSCLQKTLHRGLLAQVQGTFSSFRKATNPGEFDSRLYYRTLDYSYSIRKAELLSVSGSASASDLCLERAKQKFEEVLDTCTPSDISPLLKAILLGDRGYLDSETKDLFQSGGIVHILAISGLHLSILGMGLYKLLKKTGLPQTLCCAVSCAFMLLYGRMAGIGATSYRALFMFLLHMLALALHRTYDLLTAAMLSLVLLLFHTPLLLYSNGFLFSFGAVLGIAVLMPSLDGKAAKSQAVTLATLPVHFGFYYVFPLQSILLNLIVIPLMSAVMTGGLAVMGCGIFLPALGKAVGIVPTAILRCFTILCRVSERLPFLRLCPGYRGPLRAAVYFAVLAFTALLHERIPKFVQDVLCLLAAAVLCVSLDSGLSLDVLDTGQGDGIYIHTPQITVMIDGGSTSKSSLEEYQLVPFLQYQGTEKVDFWVITHEDEDHCSGLLDLLGEDPLPVQVGTILLPDIAEESEGENYRKILALASEKDIPVKRIGRGDVIRKGKLCLTCLHPVKNEAYSEANCTSITFFLQYGDFTALLTGDLEGVGEEECLAYSLQRSDLFPESGGQTVTILKTAHHGSSGATSSSFLEVFHPLYAAVSCGANNRYGHPHKETLERLEKAGVREIYDTRTSGAICFHTDGKRLTVRESGGELKKQEQP